MSAPATYNLIPATEAPATPSRRFSVRALLAGALAVTLVVGFVAMRWTRLTPGIAEAHVRFDMPYARGAPAHLFAQRTAMMGAPQGVAVMGAPQRVAMMPPQREAGSFEANPFYANAPLLDASPVRMPPGAPVQAVQNGMVVRNDYPSSNACSTGYSACTGPVDSSPQTVIRQCSGEKTATACRCFGNSATVVSSALVGPRCYCVLTTDKPDDAGWSMFLFCQ